MTDYLIDVNMYIGLSKKQHRNWYE